MVCDFCGEANPTWTFCTTIFTTRLPQPVDIGSPTLVQGTIDDGKWAACDTCAALIHKHDHTELLLRSMKNAMADGQFTDPIYVMIGIYASHEGFFAHKLDEGTRNYCGKAN